MELNAQQREVIIADSGPLLLVAGPGSGKTMTLVGRLAYLMMEKDVSPDHILAITFTHKAAEEIIKRVQALCASGSSDPAITTFHALCFKILKVHAEAASLRPDFRLLSDKDQQALVKKIMAQHANFNGTLRQALLALTQWKSRGVIKENAPESALSNLINSYQKELESMGALDFDDLLFKTDELFIRCPDILTHYQTQFQIVMVDEAQDLSPIQWQLIEALAAPQNEVCVIGDPDQSIYGFRGATLESFLHFEHKYPQAKRLHLEENHRSSQTIVQAAQAVIETNQKRLPKTIWTNNTSSIPIHVTRCDTPWQEANTLLATIEKLIGGSTHIQMAKEGMTAEDLENPYQFSDIAILYRLNSIGRFLEKSFMKAGLPYRLVGDIGFFERTEIQDVLAFLKLFSSEITEQEKAEARDRLLKKFGAGERVQTLENVMQNQPVSRQIRSIVDIFELKTFYDDGTAKGARRYDHILELLNIAATHDEKSPTEGREALLKQALFYRSEAYWNVEREAITLMTVHAAKGLEFPVVFVAGLEEGIFPNTTHDNADEHIEEERRLFYVAMTRAKERLVLSYAAAPSRFLNEIPERHLQKKIITAPSRRQKTLADSPQMVLF